ncbi:MAG: Nif3-like dinuclear metal center hexameric protein [Bacteroidota bacterium]|nr:Nif3-like dinuclear metal center hexameric protein [Bacteroidota bacterium]
MKLTELLAFFENWSPASLQESYDNSGLLVGSPDKVVSRALVTLEITEDVMKEAKEQKCDLIISHHPVIFGGLKKLNGKNTVERVVLEAVRNDIAIFACHTNLDNVLSGVNNRIADRLDLKDRKLLDPKGGLLSKLVVFVPETKLEGGRFAPDVMREALWKAGAGNIGDYNECSFNMTGTGTFKAGPGADPYIGREGEREDQQETRIEVIYPQYIHNKIMAALWQAHPYEEPAYDIIQLSNEFQEAGAGMIGVLDKPMPEKNFLAFLKERMKTELIRHSPLTSKPIKRVAVCGGSGSFLLNKAMAQMADVFVTSDFKYHQFFEAEGRIIIADIGHYESEQWTADLIVEKLNENFPNFAVSKSAVCTNPINYF